MIKIKAKIKLFENGRKTPFYSGYRPLFNFIPETKTSGQIILLDREKLYPGEEAIVEINFLNRKFLGKNFGEGVKFTFDESRQTLGEGEIINIL